MRDAGLKYPVVTGWTGADDALLKSFGEEAIGLVSCSPYSLDIDNPSQQSFHRRHAEELQRGSGSLCRRPLYQLPSGRRGAEVARRRCQRQGKIHGRAARGQLWPTRRAGPLKFDHFGNAVGNFYIRRCDTEGAKYGLKLWNKMIKTYRRMSASSGSGRSRNFSLTRSIRATIRRSPSVKSRDTTGLYRPGVLRQ